MSAGRRGLGSGGTPGRHGPQLGHRGRDHPAAGGGHHHGGIQPQLLSRQRQRPRQAARPAGRPEPQPGWAAAGAAEAEAAPHPLHTGAAQRAGEELRQDPLPGHLHAGRAGLAHRPHRVPGAGMSSRLRAVPAPAAPAGPFPGLADGGTAGRRRGQSPRGGRVGAPRPQPGGGEENPPLNATVCARSPETGHPPSPFPQSCPFGVSSCSLTACSTVPNGAREDLPPAPRPKPAQERARGGTAREGRVSALAIARRRAESPNRRGITPVSRCGVRRRPGGGGRLSRVLTAALPGDSRSALGTLSRVLTAARTRRRHLREGATPGDRRRRREGRGGARGRHTGS